MRETRTTEFKEMITNTFLKTVSAFSNYDGGEIFLALMTMAISKDCRMQNKRMSKIKRMYSD